MKGKKIKKLINKLSAECSDVVLFLHAKDEHQFTMAGHCTTKNFLPEIAIQAIKMHSEREEIDPVFILLNIITSMVDQGDIDREQFKKSCQFFTNIDNAIKTN